MQSDTKSEADEEKGKEKVPERVPGMQAVTRAQRRSGWKNPEH